MPKELLVREYLPGDASCIIRLHKASEESFEEIGLCEEFIDYIAYRDDFHFFLACLGDETIGFCGILYYPNMRRAEIGPIAVAEKARKSKVGRLLLENAESYLKKRGIRRVIAKVKAENNAARGFFNRMGYAEEGLFKEYTRQGEDVVQFVKFI